MKIVGHRGAKALAGENTTLAVKKALPYCDQIELDLRLSRDNVVVLCHDKFIGPARARTYLKDHSCEELVKLKPDLARLSEVTKCLDDLDSKVGLMLEIKPREDTAEICRQINKLIASGFSNKRLMVGSKSLPTLKVIKKQLPDVDLLVIESWSGVRAHFRARLLKAKYVSMNGLWLWSGFIRSFSNGRLKLYAYNVNKPARAARFKKYGLYGVITGRPDLMLR